MPGLEKITIKGFKSIKVLEDFELRPLNVFIGANGAGKSNFISVFTLLNQIVDKNLQTYVGKSGGPDTFLHYGRKVTESIFIKLWFADNGYECTLIPTLDDLMIFKNETVYFQGGGHPAPYSELLGATHKETLLYSKDRVAKYVRNAMKSWKVYHFHDTSETAAAKQLQKIDDNMFFRPDAANIATFLYLLKEKHESHYENIVNTIRLMAPFFDDFILRPNPLNPEMIKLEWKEVGSDKYFNGHALSDGTLRFICLATLLLQPDPPETIILDEPELGLHPYAIRVLAELFNSVSTKSQLVVATQSVTLVNQLTPDDIVIVEREDGQSVFKRPNKEEISEWLDDYGLGDLWEKNIIGGRP